MYFKRLTSQFLRDNPPAFTERIYSIISRNESAMDKIVRLYSNFLNRLSISRSRRSKGSTALR
jgi:hypothetical protein